MLMTRNLIYTAVTRAKKCVVLVGSAEIFREMVANPTEENRYTSLTERIREIAFPEEPGEEILSRKTDAQRGDPETEHS